MEIELEFLPKELIKPSSPTPDHLRHLQLSFLDQIQPPIFVSLLLYYKNSNINISQTSNKLKKSLSQVLTVFYPLAGRIINNSYVDCNEQGLVFVEAKANCELSMILQAKNPIHNNKFIPVQHHESNNLAAVCQITFFKCGGLAISFSISHKIADASSIFIFLKTWAAISRGNTDIDMPSFGWANLFPPINRSGFKPPTWISKENVVTKVFEFDSSSIEALVAKYSDNEVRPSRTEALSAFIWSRFMATTQGKEANKQYRVRHMVNLRPRMEPPLPKQSFGNLLGIAMAEAKDDGIVKRMRDSFRNVNQDYIKKLRNSDELLSYLKKRFEELGKEDMVWLRFSSGCNFPTYETDFGWGKPSWVATTPVVTKNVVFFLDSRDGKGIEAWISLKEEDMAKFQIDNHLLAHVSFSSTTTGSLLAQSRL